MEYRRSSLVHRLEGCAMMTLPFFKNRKSRRELEAEIKSLVETRDVKLEMLQQSAKGWQADWENAQEQIKSLERSKAQLGCHYETEAKVLRDKIESLESQPPPQIKIELVHSINLTLSKWLKEESLIASAANILKHPDMRAMLDVLENEHPGRKGLAISVTADQRAAWQSKTEGYQLCLNNLMVMGEKPGKKVEPQETFAEENAGGKK
jgi:hypothetical protein